MAFKNALRAFELLDTIDLNCGTFDLLIRQAAPHNAAFKAAVSKRAATAKRKSLVPEHATLTGSFEQDVELLIDTVVVGWGTNGLKDDDGREVAYSPDVMRELFGVGKDGEEARNGKIFFSKVLMAAVSDDMFKVSEADRGN